MAQVDYRLTPLGDSLAGAVLALGATV
ncbi:hypothetical protein MXD60_14610 [Frankia sp. AgB32]|nr:hypothetical protein [Frankia sp. AgB32]MCK9895814.1 hypothetical protein [Frankia sp. AgB32]